MSRGSVTGSAGGVRFNKRSRVEKVLLIRDSGISAMMDASDAWNRGLFSGW